MSDFEYVEHQGIVEEVLPDQVKVRIISISACAACHAKDACNASDMEDKVIDVYEPHDELSVGQRVLLLGKKNLAPLAVTLAYVLPVILIFVTLFLVVKLTGNEPLAAALALFILVPYYAVIHFLKDKLQKTFTFTIKRQIN
ncbi:MAG: SoxR reducing system RseC family protein [Chlorobi bacterium]|nr:SoxR reducing system RseC family protein [Chlorobiota bacterium]